MLIQREVIKEIIYLLEPQVSDMGFRKALFIGAFADETVLNRISWEGSGTVFSYSAIQELNNFGHCVNGSGEHSIERLLRELSEHVGLDIQQNIEVCLQKLREYNVEQNRLLHAHYQQSPPPYLLTTAENVPGETPQKVLPRYYIGDQVRSSVHQHKDDRAEMLNRLQKSWIEGVLYTALRDVQKFNIGIPLNTEALLRHKNVGVYTLDNTSEIWNIYHDFDGRLLILGAPGSGKTILLLQLAEMLLKEAKDNEGARIPMVFNLASWSHKQLPLHEWLFNEFDQFYRIRRKIASDWLNDNKFIVMLDGLDEVKEEVRAKCVDCINIFRNDFTAVRLVICSRLIDYSELPTKLNLEGAITLQPLEQADVEQYLEKQGERLTALRNTIKHDNTLKEMSRVPFLLNTMIYTYNESSPEQIGVYEDPTERRQKMFEKYVERRLQDNRSPYGYERTLKYLKWLAEKMQASMQTVLYKNDLIWPSLDKETLKLEYYNKLLIRTAIYLYMTPFLLCAIAFYDKALNDHSINSRLIFLVIFLLGFIFLFTLRFYLKIVRFIILSILSRLNRHLPLDIGEFLDLMSYRHIMRPLNGGYVFIHRYLLEALASENEILVLINQLGSYDIEIRQSAIKTLAHIGRPAIKPLVANIRHFGKIVMQDTNYMKHKMLYSQDELENNELFDKDVALLKYSLEALSKITDTEAVAMLASLLKENSYEKEAVVKALRGIGTATALHAVHQWRQNTPQ